MLAQKEVQALFDIEVKMVRAVAEGFESLIDRHLPFKSALI